MNACMYVCMYGTLQAGLPVALQSGNLRSEIAHHGRRQLRLHGRLALLHTYINTSHKKRNFAYVYINYVYIFIHTYIHTYINTYKQTYAIK